MSKRPFIFNASQLRDHNAHRQPAELALLLLAVALIVLGALLVLSGVFAMDLSQIAVGVIALIAGLGLQRHGYRR